MAQASSNTLVLSQIFMKLSEFYQKDINGLFRDDNERLQEYSEVMKNLYEKISRPLTYLDPYIKGEPPFSEKMNRFTQSLSGDINAITVDVDYLSAKTINVFNMMKTNVDKEKKYLDRIASKAKILKMYNRSPSDDLVYLGDSFENADKVDISLIKKGMNPLIRNGSASFSVEQSKDWIVTSVNVVDPLYNSKNGNNHQVRIGSSQDVDTNYKYVFEDSPNLNIVTNIIDSNPLTSFECEALSVDKSSARGTDGQLLSDVAQFRNEKEFCYVTDDRSIPSIPGGSLVNWSNYEQSSPFEVEVTLESRNSPIANAINISPFFASMDFVEVSSILVFSQDGSSEEVLKNPVFIGSSIAPVNIDFLNSYFYNDATIRFSERNLSKIKIRFTQSSPKDVDIQHLYWVPDYLDGDNPDNSPFYGLSRFNPEALSSETYEEVRFDYTSILPPYSNPNVYKLQPDARKNVSVILRKVPATYSKYVIVLPMERAGIVKDYYFTNWVDDSPSISSELKLGPNFEGVSVRYFDSQEDGQNDKDRFIEWIENSNNQTDEQGRYILSAESLGGFGAEFILDLEDIEIRFFERTFNDSDRYFTVPIRTEKEIYSAKRYAIGLRDISVYHEKYSSQFEIISTPYVFNFPVDSIMLSVDSNIDNTFSSNTNLFYYISVNNGESWIRISPIQLDNQGIPEVISFNNNVPKDFELPGVLYLNYPDIPESVNNIRVMIQAIRSRGSNLTPEVRSYELIAKVKR
jgi:hypothetical protein